MSKFRIGKQFYEGAMLDRVTLGDILRLKSETLGIGPDGGGLSWSYVTAMSERVQGLTEEEAVVDDDFPIFMGLLVWASRLKAGEKVTFGEAVDFEMGDIEFLPEPQDRKAPANPQQARPGSGRATARAGARAAKKTSASPSSLA